MLYLVAYALNAKICKGSFFFFLILLFVEYKILGMGHLILPGIH